MNRGPQLPALGLSDRQAFLLRQYVNRSQVGRHYWQRISVVLGAFSGASNSSLSAAVGLSRSRVIFWRSHWLAHYESLCRFEGGDSAQGVEDKELLGRMLEILSDAPRPGTPKRITLSEEEQLVALACRRPEEFGIPITQWNRELLAQTAIEQGIVEQISPRYVSVILKKTRPASG